MQGVRQWYILSGPQLAKRFQQVLDRAGSVITPAELSNDPNGNVNDGLAQDDERFGQIKATGAKCRCWPSASNATARRCGWCPPAP